MQSVSVKVKQMCVYTVCACDMKYFSFLKDARLSLYSRLVCYSNG